MDKEVPENVKKKTKKRKLEVLIDFGTAEARMRFLQEEAVLFNALCAESSNRFRRSALSKWEMRTQKIGKLRLKLDTL